MKQHIKKLWVAALRSGKYKQGDRLLRRETTTGTKFCCLGVLCNLHAQAHPEIAAKQKSPGKYMGVAVLPPIEVYKWADLNTNESIRIRGYECPLYKHNDDGRSFTEIADAIEEQL